MFYHWIILLAIAVGIAFIADKLQQPYPTFLVIAGLVIGIVPIPALAEIKYYATNDLIFQTAVITIFLSALLGDAALKLPLDELRENKKPILLLAFAGTFLTFFLVSILSIFLLNLSLQQSLVFGALMAATDPVSVLSIFKSMGLNKRLSIIVEGESLANDGVAVVLLKIALVTTMISFVGISQAFLVFIKVVCGGIMIGALFGFAASRITSRIDNYLVEIGLSIILFYGSFELAEAFHLSGVIAVVVGGLILGTYGKNIGMSDLTHEKMDSFWEVVAFISNALIFLMVGLQVARISFKENWMMIAGSVVVVLLARFIAVHLSLLLDKSIPKPWKHVIVWGGLKGSLSIALALSISSTFAGRDLLLAMTFTNVVFSLLGQGSTIKKLVSILGLNNPI